MELRAAYFRCALKAHPDKGGSDLEFQKLVAAFETLSTVVFGKRPATVPRDAGPSKRGCPVSARAEEVLARAKTVQESAAASMAKAAEYLARRRVKEEAPRVDRTQRNEAPVHQEAPRRMAGEARKNAEEALREEAREAEGRAADEAAEKEDNDQVASRKEAQAEDALQPEEADKKEGAEMQEDTALAVSDPTPKKTKSPFQAELGGEAATLETSKPSSDAARTMLEKLPAKLIEAKMATVPGQEDSALHTATRSATRDQEQRPLVLNNEERHLPIIESVLEQIQEAGVARTSKVAMVEIFDANAKAVEPPYNSKNSRGKNGPRGVANPSPRHKRGVVETPPRVLYKGPYCQRQRGKYWTVKISG